MEEERNYQNWLVKVNIENHPTSIEYIKEEGERLLVADDYDLKIMVQRNCYFHDKIDWQNVDIKELREFIADTQREE
ncbi:MAG: hypothetical protein ACOCRX_04775 [Candidatus Woesearchaeota archaeon]